LAAIANRLTGGIFGAFGGVLFRLLPSARKSAGVVAETDHIALKEDAAAKEVTLTHLVSAIHEMKTTDKDAYTNSLRPALLAKTSDETSRPIIEAIEAKVKASKRS